jgi:ER lumen protein retaining receptor
MDLLVHPLRNYHYLETGMALLYWNFILKIFYLATSFYILFLMLRVYPRTRERENAWRLGGYILGGSFVLTPIVAGIFSKWWGFDFMQVSKDSRIPVLQYQFAHLY